MRKQTRRPTGAASFTATKQANTQANRRGFLYSHEAHTLLDLNDLVTGLDSGWVISAANAINDQGSIVAEARDATGQTRGVILTLVPEPGTFALSVLTMLGMAWAVRRQRRQ